MLERLAVASSLSFAICLSIAPAARADLVFYVTSVADEPDDLINGICHTASNSCTLRAAIMESANVDTVVHVPSGTYSLNAEIAVPGDFFSAETLELRGAGSGSTIVDAGGDGRHFSMASLRPVLLSGLTLRDGVTAGSGGSIYSYGALTIEDCVIEGNSAANGGGIYSWGSTLTVARSTIRGNSASSWGGGIYLASTATSGTVTASTISGNDASYGGGILNQSTMYLVNSTISTNTSIEGGGGIHNSGTFWTYNVTIAFNQADSDADGSGFGGGVNSNLGSFNLRNSVVGANYRHQSQGNPDECNGTMTTFGYNKFYFFGGCSLTHAGACGGLDTQLGSIFYLEPLRFNGGPTETHSLRSDSDLRSGVLPPCICQYDGELTADQRGGQRPGQLFPLNDPYCDIGAFEYGGLPLGLIFKNGFESGDFFAW